jgi:DNA polymerase-4
MARFIAHIDMNAYFASVEQQANRFLRGRPIGVSRKPQDRTIIAAPSYEAKRFGIKTGMPTWEALELCPDLEIIPGDPAKYAYISSRIFSILKSFSPLLEVFSIDEAWLDITQLAKEYRSPLEVAKEIKKQIKKELGLLIRCSIGIAPSKVLSKIASEMKKPDGLVWIQENEVQGYLEKLEVDSACGIDKGLKAKLNLMNIRTLGDLGRCNPGRLRRAFGIIGYYLNLIGQGKDPFPLNPHYKEIPPKGFGHSRVFSFPYLTFEQAKDVLYLLCYKTARRMRAKGYSARVIHFYAAGRERGVGRQRTLSIPTADEEIIYQTCLSIAGELDLPEEIRTIAIAVSRLCQSSGLPIPLFNPIKRRSEALEAMDDINNEWGDFTVYFGSIQPVKDKVSWKIASLGMHKEVEIRDYS